MCREVTESCVHQLKRPWAQYSSCNMGRGLSAISVPNSLCQRKSPCFGQLSTEVVAGVQDSTPRRQQRYVQNSGHPHFPRARPLRKMHRAIAEFLVKYKKM